MKTIPLPFIAIVLLSGTIICQSCNNEYNPFGTELRRVTPEHEAVLKESDCFTVSVTAGMTFYMPMAAHDSILAMCLIGAENHIAAISTKNGHILGN